MARGAHPGTGVTLPREGGLYPWVVVTTLFLLVFLFWGGYSSFGVFLGPLSHEFGWSRGLVSLALTINLMVGGVLGFGIGSLTDRYGPRALMTGAALALAAGFMLVSWTSHLWQLYLSIGVLSGLGISCAYIVPTATIARWFHKRRGLALGIVLTGIGAAYMLGPPFTASLIESLGWRSAYRVLAAIIGLGAIPLALSLRRPPPWDEAGVGKATSTTVRQALSTSTFWSMFAVWITLGLSLMAVVVHLVPHATDRGIPLTTASTALTIYGVSNIVARLSFGFLVDRVGPKPAYALCVVLQTAGIVGILGAGGLVSLYATTALFGLGAAGADTVAIKTTPDIFGTAAVGAFIGILSLGWRAGAAAGPPIAGFVFDTTNGYLMAFLPVAVIGFAAGVLFLRIRSPQRTVETSPHGNHAAY
ncbi:MAG: MFS transporter [Chloroflexi bacterium]|nr:MFS transporter [Chloroflexota bacterium]